MVFDSLVLKPMRLAGIATLSLALVACGDTETAEVADVAEAPMAETATEENTVGDAMTEDAGMALLDPNTATREELMAGPALSAEAADALIAGRPYSDMIAVDAALDDHLDEAGREAAYASLWLPIDLNAASGEEILLIPGVGERMQHEFEEYRPYRAIQEFRQEIGKYVDEAEVARLERYVEIR